MDFRINKILFDNKDSKKRIFEYRKRLLEISLKVPALHIGGSLSCLHILDSIYYGMLKRDKKKLLETFILSKGHAGVVQYVLLEHLGILKKKDLDNYCKSNGFLGCHPDYKNPGIEASTGSLAHGIGIANGMAYFDKIKKNGKNVFLVMSDGELQEGSVWENMMMSANLKLSNLIAFVDHNGYQSFGKTSKNHPNFYPIYEKIVSFGWSCEEVNGHNTKEILSAFHKRKKHKPLMILCNTIKGKGISFMENNPIWHFRSPNLEEFNIALKEISQEKNEK